MQMIWFGLKKNQEIWELIVICLMHLEEAKTFRAATRRTYGAPAAGSSVRSKKRHQEVIDFRF